MGYIIERWTEPLAKSFRRPPDRLGLTGGCRMDHARARGRLFGRGRSAPDAGFGLTRVTQEP